MSAGCTLVEGIKPVCELAREVALARKAALDDVLTEARSALDTLQAEEPNLALVAAMLRSIVAAAEADAAPELVPYDEQLLAVVRELETLVSAEPSALLEQAIAATRALSGGGWVVVRQEVPA